MKNNKVEKIANDIFENKITIVNIEDDKEYEIYMISKVENKIYIGYSLKDFPN